MKEKIESIQVLGSGCPTCKDLLNLTQKVADELNLNLEVEYVTDISKMVEMGIMQSPALAINGRPILTGGGKTEAEIKEAIYSVRKE
jgi:small redox-active disulfide protein 2